MKTPTWNALGACLSIASALGLGSVACGNIYITEYLNNTAGDESTYEWFEIYNAGSASIDMSGWSVRDNAGGGVIDTLGLIRPGQFMIIARDAAAWVEAWNMGVQGANVHQWLGGNLSNTSDAMYLYDAAGVLQTSLSYTDGEQSGSSIYFAGSFDEYTDTATYQDESGGWFHTTRVAYDTIADVGNRNIDVGNPFAGEFAVPAPGALALMGIALVARRRTRRT
jgi:hypothetical protein